MGPRAAASEVSTAAAGAAAEAAARSHVAVRELDGGAEIAAAACLLAELWAAPGGAGPVPADLLTAFELSGSYVAGAFAGDEIVGVSIAFATPATPPTPLAAAGTPVGLHSHVTGVSATHRHSGAGVALKLHQRAWALARGIGSISWTFDPLVARNARFNLSRLGARVERYLVDLYGPLDDAINRGDESDRLLVRWSLADPEVTSAAAGRRLVVREAPGAPRLRRVAMPEDIEALRVAAPKAARAWRESVRAALFPVLESGGRVVGLSDDGDYLLQDPLPTDDA